MPRYRPWTRFNPCFHALGDASRVVANIPIQGDNYARAYEMLRSRYENKRSIINAHLDTLFSLKPVNKKCARSPEQVRSTVAITIELRR